MKTKENPYKIKVSLKDKEVEDPLVNLLVRHLVKDRCKNDL